MEILDIVDEHGQPTGQTADRETAHALGLPHRTAHVWLVRRHAGRIQVLLQKRCQQKDAFPGCYDISSAGHIPAGVDYIPSALRELREELGVTLREDDLVFCADRLVTHDGEFHGKPFHNRQYSRVFCAWCPLEESAFTLQKEEIEQVRWMDLEECISAVEENRFPNCISTEELFFVREKTRG